MTKTCRRGHTSERYKNGDCKECARERYRADAPAKIAAARAYSRSRPRETMLLGAKHRAIRKNLPFNLELEDIVIPKICPVFGTAITKPALDRKRNELGYVKGNVRVISDRANRLKSDATLQELWLLLDDAKKIASS